MHEDFKYVESLEKEIDELESDKADFSNMYDLLLQECVSKVVMCSYFVILADLDTYNELKYLYLHKVKECEYLAEKLSKQTKNVNEKAYNELSRSFAKLEKHSISVELDLQNCKDRLKNDTIWKEKESNVFRKEREQYHEIQDLKAQLQDKNIAISELKKLNERCKGKSMENQFDRPSVVRQPNAQRIPKPLVLGKPTPFSNSPAIRMFFQKKMSWLNKTNGSDGSYYNQSLHRFCPNSKQKLSTLRSNQMKDKVIPNNSQVTFMKMEVEDHRRISSISNKRKSVTACNDSLNSKTLNVNAVCADCRKCVFNSNHDACVSKYLNDVNARTKKPNLVPISARKPKAKANKSVATPHKKTVAPDTICVDLILCTISPQDNVIKQHPLCLMAKASPTQSWLWHRRHYHLNFDVPHNNPAFSLKKDIVIGLPKLKYVKDQLCSSCEVSKAKRSSFKKKAVPSSKGRLNLLHMNLCDPMRVASINGKKYILVIVDDYS
ncbi:retrovirus-related pol polyprotein from transposon TNT 1-94 [Tanacetum coccineum]